jgi:elongin-A
MQEAEARRLEELATKLRSQRQEEIERKKEREVKITDRLPPPKRLKTGCTFKS